MTGRRPVRRRRPAQPSALPVPRSAPQAEPRSAPCRCPGAARTRGPSVLSARTSGPDALPWRVAAQIPAVPRLDQGEPRLPAPPLGPPHGLGITILPVDLVRERQQLLFLLTGPRTVKHPVRDPGRTQAARPSVSPCGLVRQG